MFIQRFRPILYFISGSKTNVPLPGYFLLSALILINTAFIPASRIADDWQLRKTENGITVYSKKPTSGSTAVKEIKVTCNITSNLGSCVYLLLDKPGHVSWVYNCKSASELKKISDLEYYHYQVTLVPWPGTDRDMVVWFRISQDTNKKVTILVSSKPDYIPPKSGLVRIQHLEAKWIFTPKKDNSVDVEYYLSLDPGGNIPDWMINMGIVDGPYKTMVNMKTKLLETKYKNVKLPFIKE